ncbi:MAG: biotin--[acetyl-CoA-carboxylase] ligase [Tissierellales bacterium]|jgi:BirA family biotin operon repressor/biotin-[acetyl-CoA-carboxylase] ligase|nr:biotin--[acetyl-CoA-carboxylase] ligase [Tissierellales bacterium]
MKQKILEFLIKNENDYISGQEMSEKLGVSRNAVWKHIQNLKKEGFQIESIKHKGYKLVQLEEHQKDCLNYGLISPYLDTEFIGNKIYYYDSVGSTNVEAKKLADKNSGEGWIVIAEEQTEGKGRLGRTWQSPKKTGIWMSIVLRPDVEPREVPQLTQLAAAALIEALAKFGIEAQIKWPNDIVINGKKICGILTEMTGTIERLNYIILGIGMNVNLEKNDFPEELLDKATSIYMENGQKMNRQELVGEVLNSIEKYYKYFVAHDHEKYLDVCRANSVLIGKTVRIIKHNKERKGVAVGIDNNGALIVEIEGKLEKVISGEVSVRGLYGYSE